jgi:hypothetical protein
MPRCAQASLNVLFVLSILCQYNTITMRTLLIDASCSDCISLCPKLPSFCSGPMNEEIETQYFFISYKYVVCFM